MTTDTPGVIPLCVDLDGTLLRTDTTWEAVLLLLRHGPARMPLLPLWALRGRVYFKERLAEAVAVDVRHFPLNEELLAYLKEQRGIGRPLVLVTGAAMATARAIQEHLGLFTHLLATGEGINLTGRHKAKMLVELYGEKGFDYVGNAAVDLQVWPHARHAIVVNAGRGVYRRASSSVSFEREFRTHTSFMRAFPRSFRARRWAMNVLVLLPLAVSYAAADEKVILRALIAFVCFCLCGAAMSLVDDLLDLAPDRQHPHKRLRPLAAGELAIPVALAAIPPLLITGGLLSFLLPLPFRLVLLAYVALSLAYSYMPNGFPVLRGFSIVAFGAVRVVAGCAALGLPIMWGLAGISGAAFLGWSALQRAVRG